MVLNIRGKEKDIELLKNKINPNKNILSMHVLGFNTFETYRDIIKVVDYVEIKPDKFKREDRLFDWIGNDFQHIERNFNRLAVLAKDNNVIVQFHPPFGKFEGVKLDIGNDTDHDLLIKVFAEYAKVINKFGFGQNLTIHPPEINDHNDPVKVNNALHSANKFFIRLGEEIEKNNWNIIIGVENQPTFGINNYPIDALGYDINHFDIMLKNTNKFIQTTLDSGHRLLAESDLFSANKLVDWCRQNEKYITNFHFHQNFGIKQDNIEQGKTCDLHDLAIYGGVNGYNMYIARAILEDIPLNLEINFKNYEPEQIFDYVNYLKGDIDLIYNDIECSLENLISTDFNLNKE